MRYSFHLLLSFALCAYAYVHDLFQILSLDVLCGIVSYVRLSHLCEAHSIAVASQFALCDGPDSGAGHTLPDMLCSLEFDDTASFAQRFVPDEHYYSAFSFLCHNWPFSSVKALLCALDNTACGIQGTARQHGRHGELFDMVCTWEKVHLFSAYLCRKIQVWRDTSLGMWSIAFAGYQRSPYLNCLSFSALLVVLSGGQGYPLFSLGSYPRPRQPVLYHSFTRSKSGSIEGEVYYRLHCL